MKKLILILTPLLCLLLLLTGCWSKKELDELAIASAVGIDREGEEYIISTQVMNPDAVTSSAKGGSDLSPVVTYSVKGKSLFEAFRKTTKVAPRKIYLSHLRILVISEAAAKEGIVPLIDFLSRDHQLRTDFYILVSQNISAEHILKTVTLLDKIPANKMYDSLNASASAWGSTVKTTLDHLITDITTEGKSAVLTGITLTGNSDIGASLENTKRLQGNAILKYVGLGVFDKDKLVGWLSEEESKAYNYIQGDVKSTVEAISCPGKRGTITLELLTAKSHTKGKIVQGKPEVTINLEMQTNIAEVECALDLIHDETIHKIEAAAAKKLKSSIINSIHTAQNKYRTDYFGFGNDIHRASPQYWRKWGAEWNEQFSKLNAVVNVDVRVRGMGTTHNSYGVKE